MHDKLKTYFTGYSGTVYIVVAVLIILCGWFIFGGGSNSDHQSTVEHLERAKGQQCKSLELNQTVEDSVDSSAQLNQQASERISRAQEYQQRAIESIDQSAKRLDEAERLLERNAELIERVEQGHQAQSSNGTETAPPTKHVGVD